MKGEGRWIDGVWYEPMDELMVEPPGPTVEPDEAEWRLSIEAALIELAALIGGGDNIGDDLSTVDSGGTADA